MNHTITSCQPLSIADIKTNDITNGLGINVSLWVNGCGFNCNGCHNASLQNLNNPSRYSEEEAIQIIATALNDNRLSRGLSILGGEPLYAHNPERLLYILDRLDEMVERDFPIYLWTGFSIETLTQKQRELASRADYIIDGLFIIQKFQRGLKLRGSTNQRIFKRTTNDLSPHTNQYIINGVQYINISKEIDTGEYSIWNEQKI